MNKWDLDLITIASLNILSQKLNVDFVLKGGMATEAYLGGKQQREHGDIDSTVYLNSVIVEDFTSKVNLILSNEKTKWKLYSSPPKMEYREVDSTKEFFDKRRLEMNVRDTFDGAYETGKYQVKKLVDSKGREIEVNVMELSELVAMKIRNIFMTNHNIGDMARQSSETDYSDLRKLINLKEHSKGKTLDGLGKILAKNRNMKEAKEEAGKEYDFVINLLQAIVK